MFVLPSVLVLSMAALYGSVSLHPVVGNALRGMGSVSAGLILATGLKLLPAVRRNPMGRAMAALLALATLAAVVWLRLPLPWLVLLLGGLGMAAAWRGLKADPRTEG
jgi:chromate transporter